MPVQNALTAVMTLNDATPTYNPKAQIEGLLRSQGVIVLGALQRLGFVHFARFCFIEAGNETKFAIITNYDFDFEDYMNIFIDELGEMFDAMLEHVKNAPPTPVRKYRSEFIEHVREIDLTNPSKLQAMNNLTLAKRPDFAVVYSAYPDLSVQHIWKMREESYA